MRLRYAFSFEARNARADEILPDCASKGTSDEKANDDDIVVKAVTSNARKNDNNVRNRPNAWINPMISLNLLRMEFVTLKV